MVQCPLQHLGVSYWKGSLCVTLDEGRQLYFTSYIYIYIYIHYSNLLPMQTDRRLIYKIFYYYYNYYRFYNHYHYYHYYHHYYYYCYCYFCYSLRVFQISVSWWFSTGVWVTASLLKSPGLFTVFWPISTML